MTTITTSATTKLNSHNILEELKNNNKTDPTYQRNSKTITKQTQYVRTTTKTTRQHNTTNHININNSKTTTQHSETLYITKITRHKTKKHNTTTTIAVHIQLNLKPEIMSYFLKFDLTLNIYISLSLVCPLKFNGKKNIIG